MAFNTLETFSYPLPFSVHSSTSTTAEIDIQLTGGAIGNEPRYIHDLNTGVIHEIDRGAMLISVSEGVERRFELLYEKTERSVVSYGDPLMYMTENILNIKLVEDSPINQISIFTIEGKLVRTVIIDQQNDHVSIPLFQTGTYVIRCEQPNGSPFVDKVVYIRN